MLTKARWAGAAAAVFLASSAYGAHPLNTEDTGTQGKGGWQLELNGERNRDEVDGETVKGAQAAVVLSHGIAENLDLQFGMPWQDNGSARGGGDLVGAVKWRFWEQGAFSAGTRAGVSAPTGDEDRELGNGRPTWAAILIGQYEGERWIFLAHLGYRRNLNSAGNRESIGEVSGAVLYKASGNLKLLIDANRTTNPDRASDRALQQAVAGAIYSPTRDLDLDVGFRRGNEPAIDKALMAGLTLRW
jgi:Putative MetA-pathway of phenol degradation